MGRHILVQGFRLNRAKYSRLGCLPQIAGIDGHQYFGRGVGAFGLQTSQQRAGLVSDVANLYAGLFGIGIKHGFDQVFLACRIQGYGVCGING